MARCLLEEQDPKRNCWLQSVPEVIEIPDDTPSTQDELSHGLAAMALVTPEPAEKKRIANQASPEKEAPVKRRTSFPRVWLDEAGRVRVGKRLKFDAKFVCLPKAAISHEGQVRPDQSQEMALEPPLSELVVPDVVAGESKNQSQEAEMDFPDTLVCDTPPRAGCIVAPPQDPEIDLPDTCPATLDGEDLFAMHLSEEEVVFATSADSPGCEGFPAEVQRDHEVRPDGAFDGHKEGVPDGCPALQIEKQEEARGISQASVAGVFMHQVAHTCCG